MRKTSKGVVAAGAGVALLLGGGGTLAYWNADVDTGGNALNSGRLALVANPGCGGWFFDDGEAEAGKAFDPAVDKIVPGDVLTRDCEFAVDAQGEHLRATIDIGLATFSYTSANTYGDSIHAALADLKVDGVATNVITEDSLKVTATETVTFDYGTTADNSTQNVVAVLNAVTVTATQQHN